MSDATEMRDDPLTPAEAEALTALFPPGVENIPYADSEPNIKTFAVWQATDRAGVTHRVMGKTFFTNNNPTWLEYQPSKDGVVLLVRRFILGPTTDIMSPAYGKIDGFSVTVVGRDLQVSIWGHRIRNAGSTCYSSPPLLLRAVWAVWPDVPGDRQTFPDVPRVLPGGQPSPFWLPVEQLHAAGVLGGYPDGTFKPANPISRGAVAKIVAGSEG